MDLNIEHAFLKLNFLWLGEIHEICENIGPQKLPAIYGILYRLHYETLL